MEINRLIEIAQSLGFEDLEKDLQWLSYRLSQKNCPLILPLVGEFSAGKTTLLNSLTDNKKLETDIKPTTATIFEIHFGCDSCRAIVFDSMGERKEVPSIEDLKNADLADAKVVEVFDTSKRVPSSTIIVDTPGLSSPNPKHKQTLVDFLPKADGVLLVIDINQGLTKSTTDQEFLKTIALSKRPIYAVFTQCDLKSNVEIEAQKKYLMENAQIPIKDIVCVSGKTGDLDELYQLLQRIQNNKDVILSQVNQQRLKNTAALMSARIDELLNATHSDKELEEAILEKKDELNKLNRNIDRLVASLEEDIETNANDVIRKFEDVIFAKLDSLVTGKSANFDAEAISAINTTTSLLFNEFKETVKDTLKKTARARRNGDDAVTLRSLDDVDVSSLSMQGVGYNLNLNAMGHEYDSLIATAATAAVVIGSGIYGGIAAGAGAAVDNIDTATDIIFDGGSMIKDSLSIAQPQNDQQGMKAGQNSKKEEIIVGPVTNQTQSGGLLTQLVGLVTDNAMGKPQRRRAIRDYMDGVLIPNFKSEIKNLSRHLVASISDALHEEAAQSINEMTEALEQLRVQMREQRQNYQNRINELRAYKSELLNI